MLILTNICFVWNHNNHRKILQLENDFFKAWVHFAFTDSDLCFVILNHMFLSRWDWLGVSTVWRLGGQKPKVGGSWHIVHWLYVASPANTSPTLSCMYLIWSNNCMIIQYSSFNLTLTMHLWFSLLNILIVLNERNITHIWWQTYHPP